MSYNIRLKSRAIYGALLMLLVFTACKKNKNQPKSDPQPAESNSRQTPTTDRTELTNDSLFLYAKQIYYWNTALPMYDAYLPRQYNTTGSELDNYENNLFNLVKSSKSADYETSSPYPKYSYIDDITTKNPNASSAVPNAKQSVDLEGNGNDIGIRPVYYLTNEQTHSYLLFITAVYPGSDADKKGVKRGWLIKKVNGMSIGGSYDAERTTVNAQLNAESVTLEGTVYKNKIEGEAFTVTLKKTIYKSNPIYLSKVFTAGNKKVGYLSYARFSNAANSNQVLDDAFSGFASQGVTDLIIDLRYNGGGYISTAQRMINLIAPSTATGIMYKEYYNSTMQNKNATILKNQPYLDENDKIKYKNGRMMNLFDDVDYSVAGNTYNFSKLGNLTGITNVVFIVSGSTASASELVINSLKPKMNVKLVGDVTYGKPIGFFPIRLQNRYDVYFSLFETKNSLDQGGYFTGMVPDFKENNNEPAFFDDPRYEAGDKNEGYLAKAISVLNPSGLVVTGNAGRSIMSVNGREVVFDSQNVIKPVKENGEFVGMIEDRINAKK
jgi:carboxyl-terminal processing protease